MGYRLVSKQAEWRFVGYRDAIDKREFEQSIIISDRWVLLFNKFTERDLRFLEDFIKIQKNKKKLEEK